MKKYSLTFVLLIVFLISFGQKKEVVNETFGQTRIINFHSVETLPKRILDIRITHRFGDIAVPDAEQTFWGLDNASDIGIGLEYGIIDELDVGLYRYKGAGPQTNLFEGFLKWKFLKQRKKGNPFTMTWFSSAVISAMNASTNPSSATAFTKFLDRLSYVFQVNIATNIKHRISLQFTPTYIHRNFVAYDDVNDVIGLGGGIRIRATKTFAIIGELNYTFPTNRTSEGFELFPSFSIGFEFMTKGHVFVVGFSNSEGISQDQFIPYTRSQWLEGQFRLGFSISRLIKI